MANKTVYPFGTGGQLPSNIGIINDLTTGGADKALSAEMGKELTLHDNRIIMTGAGNTAVTMQLQGLLAGRTYRLVTDKVWAIDELTIGNNVATLVFGNIVVSKAYHDAIRITQNDYTVPANTTQVALTIRANSGVQVSFNLIDVTADYSIATRGFSQKMFAQDHFTSNGYFNTDGYGAGGLTGGIDILSKNFIGVIPSNTYDIVNPSSYLIGYCTYNKEKAFIERKWFDSRTSISIPSNCYFIRLMLRLSTGLTIDTMDSYIVLKMHVDDVPTLNSDNFVKSGGVYAALEGKQDKYKEEDVTNAIANNDGRYIQYSSGKSISTLSGLRVFYMKTDGLFSVQCTVGNRDTIPSAIAFYSSDNFDPTKQFPSGYGKSDGQGGYKDRYYMQSESVQAISGTNTYTAVVPNDAKWVAFSNLDTSLASPTFKVYKSVDASEEIVRVESIADKGVNIASNALNPFINAPHYYHFAPNNFLYNPNKSIASESLEDIEIAARLGFKFIEANIQQTSDGKFIVIHGESGKLGREVKSTNESIITTDNLRNSAISSLTLEYIKTYAVYDSSIVKYQTTVPSLEEFCQSCKTHDIGIFAGTNVKEAVEICVKYLGSNMIVYNPPANIRDYFNGFVYKFIDSSSINPASELDTARSYGVPYMCGLGATALSTLKTNQTLDTLIENMHAEGFLVGCTGVYDSEANVRDALKRGMDFNCSGWNVNPFEHNFEIFDINDANELPTTTGTIVDGVVTMAVNDTLTCGSDTAISLGKCCLMIRFDGELTISFGHHENRNVHGTVSSDGSEMLVLTDYVLGKRTKLTITAVASTTITGFVYKTSKC